MTPNEFAALVLGELGDTEETIWTTAEIIDYLRSALYDFMTRTLCTWKRLNINDVAGQATYELKTELNDSLSGELAVNGDFEQSVAGDFVAGWSNQSTGSVTAAPSDAGSGVTPHDGLWQCRLRKGIGAAGDGVAQQDLLAAHGHELTVSVWGTTQTLDGVGTPHPGSVIIQNLETLNYYDGATDTWVSSVAYMGTIRALEYTELTKTFTIEGVPGTGQVNLRVQLFSSFSSSGSFYFDTFSAYMAPALGDFHQLDRAEYDYQPVSAAPPRQQMAMNGYFESAGNRPFSIIMEGDGIRVLRKIGVPTVDAATFIIEYYAAGFFSPIQLDTDLYIPTRYLTYVAHRVKAMAYGRDGDGQSLKMSQFWTSRYEDGIEMVRRRRERLAHRRIGNIGNDGKVPESYRKRDPGTLPPYFPKVE